MSENEEEEHMWIVDNKRKLQVEMQNMEHPLDHHYDFLYPSLDDPQFNVKIAQKKEFSDTAYDGTIYDVETYANQLKTDDYELLPQQVFIKNFLSFQTPYNSVLLFHGLGSGKTCTASGVCEEMRDYLKQMNIGKRIIIVATPNVQNNFRLQLFDERKLTEIDGVWTIKGCLGNKLLKEINPTNMKGIERATVVQQVKQLIESAYSFQGYVQFSNEILRKAGNGDVASKIRNLEHAYSNSLIVIDEVHNIRISEDNENKSIAKNLMFLVSVVSNIRLLLLSATPMFNSYREIIWLLNLMNMNDRRGIISVSDVFDKKGNWKKDKHGNEIGKEILVQKATGYISYVRGENPYTFPFRVYPDRFAPSHTFRSIEEYPRYQINGKKIPQNKKIQKLSLFLTVIGEYQEKAYRYIIDRLRDRTKKTAFSDLRSFGYTDLQIPIESLNIVYPHEELERLTKFIQPISFEEDEEDEEDDDEKEDEEEDDFYSVTSMVDATEEEMTKESEAEQSRDLGVEQSRDLGVEQSRDLGVEQSRDLGAEESRDLGAEQSRDLGVEESRDLGVEESRDLGAEQSAKKKKRKNKTELIVRKKKGSDAAAAVHRIEGNTLSREPTQKNELASEWSSSQAGGSSSSSSASLSSVQEYYIDPKELTGSLGLKRIMNYEDVKSPSAFKGKFEYKPNTPHIFQPDKIGHYSAKIKNICESIYNSDTQTVSDGIILIYSSYLDAGIIPMALALEEMGFVCYKNSRTVSQLFKQAPVPAVDVRTMQPPQSKSDFKPARYVMITGDVRISPDNDAAVKAVTDIKNLSDENSGEIIKVVLISQSGSEGLDLKGIRQVHILDPWYNVNRLEQIIGRAVRNFSHKELPFSKRNVQIYLYGTLLKNTEEEAADLYVYRISEWKSIKIGKVSRLLKQTAIDCIIHHEQTQLTAANFADQNITQILSDHQQLDHFRVGDLDNSPTCDFMECEFKCVPDLTTGLGENIDTYNESFMLVNSEKIINKIKALMKEHFFYKSKDLFARINTPKSYPLSQIYAALSQIIDDNSEFLVDKYGRMGYLVNIGDYYLFQPSELNYKNISIYDRSVPIAAKHKSISYEMESLHPPPPPFALNDQDKLLNTMHDNYRIALRQQTNTDDTTMVDNWYSLYSTLEYDDDDDDNDQEIRNECLIEHIVDSLLMEEKVKLLQMFLLDDKEGDLFYEKVKKYLFSKQVVANGITGIVLYNGPSRKDNFHLFVLSSNSRWEPAEPEDIHDLEQAIQHKYTLPTNKTMLNRFIGFIGFERNQQYMAYQVKDTTNKRSTGFRCHQAGKEKITAVFQEMQVIPPTENIKTSCVRQEMILRMFEKKKVDGKRWFVDTETAIYNEFQQKDKKK